MTIVLGFTYNKFIYRKIQSCLWRLGFWWINITGTLEEVNHRTFVSYDFKIGPVVFDQILCFSP